MRRMADKLSPNRYGQYLVTLETLISIAIFKISSRVSPDENSFPAGIDETCLLVVTYDQVEFDTSNL